MALSYNDNHTINFKFVFENSFVKKQYPSNIQTEWYSFKFYFE